MDKKDLLDIEKIRREKRDVEKEKGKPVRVIIQWFEGNSVLAGIVYSILVGMAVAILVTLVVILVYHVLIAVVFMFMGQYAKIIAIISIAFGMVFGIFTFKQWQRDE